MERIFKIIKNENEFKYILVYKVEVNVPSKTIKITDVFKEVTTISYSDEKLFNKLLKKVDSALMDGICIDILLTEADLVKQIEEKEKRARKAGDEVISSIKPDKTSYGEPRYLHNGDI